MGFLSQRRALLLRRIDVEPVSQSGRERQALHIARHLVIDKVVERVAVEGGLLLAVGAREHRESRSVQPSGRAKAFGKWSDISPRCTRSGV